MPQLVDACCAATVKSDKPIIAMAGAIVNGVINLKTTPTTPNYNKKVRVNKQPKCL